MANKVGRAVSRGANASGVVPSNSTAGHFVTEHNLSVGTPSPVDVANAILRLAAIEDEPDPLTHLRLQKLMYYVQAWSLANRKRPAFVGRIEAWAHGPVVKELYSKLAKYGNQPIPFNALCEEASPLSAADSDFVASVWNAYKGFTAFALRQMTHNERPWIEARGASGPADACQEEITQESIRDYFQQSR